MTTKSVTLAEWLAQAYPRLAAASESAAADLRVLAADRLGRTPSWVSAHPEICLTDDQYHLLEGDLQQLVNGTPLPYLLGRVYFFGHEFQVTPDVLIPRPETELLVETALGWLREHSGCRRGVDVGCGSGCIPVSLALEIPDLWMAGVDISPKAMRIAEQNVAGYALNGRIELTQTDLLEGFDLTDIHLVTANLPYIPTETVQNLEVARHEPLLALDGGLDGLDLIRRLLEQVSGRLVAPFALYLEIEYRQKDAVLSLAKQWYQQANCRVINDLAGLPRLAEIRGE
jgi:release factor glutamine methyltransferase